MQLRPQTPPEVAELVRLECRAFAAKIRMARAVLGWSQSELAFRTGLTQRGIHKIEQGETEPRRATVRAVEAVWCDEGVEFEDLPDGGFRVNVRAALFDRPIVPQSRHRQAAPAPVGIASIAYLARRA